MKRPAKAAWPLLIAVVLLSLFAKLQAIPSSDQQQTTPKIQSIDIKNVPSETPTTTTTTTTTKPPLAQDQPATSQQIKPKTSSSGHRQNNGRVRKTTTRQPTPIYTHHQSGNISSTGAPSTTTMMTTKTLDPYELAQEEIRRMMEYHNTPPLFVTTTRDFFVDVARYPLGYKLATMQAVDSEGDRIQYSLQPAIYRDASPYFSINSTTGELRLANKKFKLESNRVGHQPSGHHDDSDEFESDADDEAEESDDDGEQVSTQERPGYLYFLNVAANDGHYPSVVELQIHVFNSSSFGTKSVVQLTTEDSRGGKQRIESLIRNKTNEFFDRIYHSSNLQTKTVDNSTIVFPDFVNPSLTQPEERLEILQKINQRPIEDLTTRGKQAFDSPQQTVDPFSRPATPATLSKVSPIDNNEIWHDQNRIAQQQQVELMPQQMFMSLVIVACSFLVIVLVLLIFIVPLSVKRLRKRLKTVERHHEQLSRNASSNGGGSSTIGSSSTGGSMTTGGGHLPSLSRFTMNGSDGSCVGMASSVDRSSAVCRQSSLDSSMTDGGATISSSMYNHRQMSALPDPMFANNRGGALHQLTNGLNRVNNGSIANPMYLHQHHASKSPMMMPIPHNRQEHFQQTTGLQMSYDHHHQGTRQPEYLPPMANQMTQNFAMDSKSQVGNDIYYPLDDEFYSTINTESTIVDNNGHHQQQQPTTNHSILQMNQPGLANHQVGSLSGHTIESKNYFASQCAQPLMQCLNVDSQAHRDTDTPESTSSRSSTRSLARFLSLPARHWAHQNEQNNDHHNSRPETKSNLDDLNYHFGQATLKQRDPIILPKTLARTTHIDREKQIRSRKCKDEQQKPHVWELERHRLKFLEILDEGQFGLVWRCKLRQPLDNTDHGATSETTVAVKTLKRHQSFTEREEREREELLAEIEIMKLVCDHPNVVKLLHCCTTDLGSSKPILLVMEYIELGKLQSFLEKSRNAGTYATTATATATNNYSICPAALVDELMLDGSDQIKSSSPTYYDLHLTSRDLIKFIYHVAKGMEYISSQCIVHRDLASRNVLVSATRVCKIGDFGMARHMQSLGDVYERHSRNAKIPVRWMAPEVLHKNRFTTKSDVFSFGILMWEIVTLGSTPYRHLKTEQVIEAVARDGERPSKPEYCHSELYTIMSSCWHHEPDDRPSFGQLVKQLDELLLSANEYIELDQYPDHIYSNIPKQAAPNELL